MRFKGICFFDRVKYGLLVLLCSFLWTFKEKQSPLLGTKSVSQTVPVTSIILPIVSYALLEVKYKGGHF